MAGERVIYSKKGVSVTVTVLQGENTYKQLRINDIPEVPTDYGCLQTFHMLAHLPCLFHKNPQKALVICFGGGITTGAMATHGLAQIDAVEICLEVIEANLYFFKENQYILADDRLNLIIDDGRNHLLSSKNQYDIIASDSTHPCSSDSWVLYIKEFYESCKRRLNPGGIMCQWLPIHGLTTIEYKRILKTFLSVFPNTTLWFVNRFTILLGTPERLKIDFKFFAEKLNDKKIRDDLKQFNLEDPYAFLSYFITDDGMLSRYTQGVETNTESCPLLRPLSHAQLPVDTKPLNLLDLSAIRKSASCLLDDRGKNLSNDAMKLNKYFEAKYHVIQGRIFCFNEMYREEKESYEKALCIVPEDKDTHYLFREAEFNLLLAEAKKYMDIGSYDTASKIYTRALNINPKSRAPYYNLGIIYFKMGQHDIAVKYFKKAVELVPWSTETRFNLAMAYFKAGMHRDCRSELENSLRFDPTFESAKQALAKLELLTGLN